MTATAAELPSPALREGLQSCSLQRRARLLRLEVGVLGDLAEDRRPILVALLQLFWRAAQRRGAGLRVAIAQIGVGQSLLDLAMEECHHVARQARWAHDAA